MGRRIALAVTTLLIGLSGCSGSGSTEAQPTRPTSSAPATTPTQPSLPAIDSYVALGDSFTAGPGLAELRDGAGACLRSTHNWPSLLAERLRSTSFEDASCAGASTVNVLGATGGFAGGPAQIDAVKDDTELVTVGIGGNDGNLFTSLITACTGGNGACASFARGGAQKILDQTTPRITTVLQDVRAKAPDATVLLVGYLRIMPASGTCADIGIPEADASAVVAAEQALDKALARAAKDARVGYVSMRAASRGHDACAGKDAWTNGGTVRDDDGIGFHPRLAGMRAVADSVAAALAKG